jgi:hypothetical protein
MSADDASTGGGRGTHGNGDRMGQQSRSRTRAGGRGGGEPLESGSDPQRRRPYDREPVFAREPETAHPTTRRGGSTLTSAEPCLDHCPMIHYTLHG